MYAMNNDETSKKRINIAKEAAQVGVFTAFTIATQLCLSAVPGVELVTVLFVSYAFTFGVRRGMIAATVFSLLRQMLFGFFPNVLVLYLLYYNGLAALFGFFGKWFQASWNTLIIVTVASCLSAVCFTLLDCVITPFWLRYSPEAAKMYFYAAIPFMIPQVICAAVSVSVLFIPLQKAFRLVKK